MASVPSTESNTQIYRNTEGLTSGQNAEQAAARDAQTENFEYEIEVHMRGDVNLNPTMQVALSGTQSDFDRTYNIISIVHRFSVHDGYSMEINAGTNASGSGAAASTLQAPENPNPNEPTFGNITPPVAPPSTQNPFSPAQVGPNPAGITP